MKMILVLTCHSASPYAETRSHVVRIISQKSQLACIIFPGEVVFFLCSDSFTQILLYPQTNVPLRAHSIFKRVFFTSHNPHLPGKPLVCSHRLCSRVPPTPTPTRWATGLQTDILTWSVTFIGAPDVYLMTRNARVGARGVLVNYRLIKVTWNLFKEFATLKYEPNQLYAN